MEAAKDQSILVVCQRYSGDGDNRDSDDVRVRHAIRPHAPQLHFWETAWWVLIFPACS